MAYSQQAPRYDTSGPTPIFRPMSTTQIGRLASDNGGFWSRPNSGTSARDVVSTELSGPAAEEASMYDQMTAYMDKIFELTDRNSARSEAQAALLRDWQQRQNQIAMQFNSSEAAKNRDWQKMMSDTAHQREVQDLRAAGLNPVLSAMGGNGAAVTSGATASGVTSAGAKGEVDTSATSAMVNLIGTMWQAQTQLEMQRASAQNNLAIAEKQAQSNQLVAEIYGKNGILQTQLAGQYNVQVADIHAAVSKLVGQLQAGATVNSAQIHAAASRYASDMGLKGIEARNFSDQLIATANQLNQYNIADLTSGRQAQSALDVAKEHLKSSQTGSLWTLGEESGLFDWLFGSSGFDTSTRGHQFGGRQYSPRRG